MGLANCKGCGRLYNQQTHLDVCPQCRMEEERQFYAVRDYLREHRRSTIYELSDSTETPVSLIIKWIREGRISTSDHPELHYPCESCGAPTLEGKYCKPCKDRLTKGFEQTKQELTEHRNSEQQRGAYYHRRKD
ncbi:flagellar operon protein (TIGR03826 family) [Tumebacillus sp. BK434]|uniref:flagellar protein n=1 Tax=Tumebacillus sp. BK434 TaxID=2512169 RepID=UPI00104445CD|nr:flagellar protein [Tumebacillus sp. BK434]TCP57832.1 flagellar operon protein (TIGR03826 family) [Tumebacillus sp. BK434]